MKKNLFIFFVGLVLGIILTGMLIGRFIDPVDPEIITVEVPVPDPYLVEVEVPVPAKVDTSSIWEMALATVDSAYIQSLVYIDSSSIIDLALSQVDTAAILRLYYSTFHYNQTITDDTLFSLQLSQAISQNKIQKQSAEFSLLKNEIKYVPMATQYISVGGVANVGVKPGIGPSLSYKNENWTFGGGYDCINKSAVLQVHFTLFSWH